MKESPKKLNETVKLTGSNHLPTTRGTADYFDWPNRSIRDVGIASDLFSTLRAEGKAITIPHSVRPGPAPNSPPDCIAATSGGELIAVELTELVDRSFVAHKKQDRGYHPKQYSKTTLTNRLQEILARKQRPVSALKGGPFAYHILIIHTDEPYLTPKTVSRYLEGVAFQKSDPWDEVFFILPPLIPHSATARKNPHKCWYTRLAFTGAISA